MIVQPRKLAQALIVLLTLSACAKQKTSESVFEKAGEECVADVIPQQFMVRYTSGDMEVVRAQSEQAFLDGFVTENLNRIEMAEPDYFVHSSLRAESLSPMAAAPTVDNWGVIRVGADQLWGANYRGAGVKVAVVDSGMDVHHPLLANRVFTNTNEIADNGIDDDQNGKVDDYYGWDYVAGKGLTVDNQYHGTHVAGIIAAYHNDTVAAAKGYVQGMAPEAKILPLAFLNKDGEGAMSNGVKAIEYAITRGARVINASWGGSVCSKTLRNLIEGLDAKNVMMVAAAGNESMNIDRYKSYPASFDFPALFTIGATGDHDIMAEYSNFGSHSVHIFAPGTSIISSIPNSMMAALSGTSMAAPMVAGAVALLLSAEPTATNTQIRKALSSSAFKQPSYLNASYGRLDMHQALVDLRHLMGK